MRCDACGETSPENARYCSNCGEPLARADEEVTRIRKPPVAGSTDEVRAESPADKLVAPPADPYPTPPPVLPAESPTLVGRAPVHWMTPHSAAEPADGEAVDNEATMVRPGTTPPPPPAGRGPVASSSPRSTEPLAPVPRRPSGPPRRPPVPPSGPSFDRGPGRRGLWITLAAVVAVIVVVAVSVPLVLAARGGDEVVVSSTSSSTTSSTTTRPSQSTTTSRPAPSSSSTTASTTPAPGIPGDSSGEWVEIDVPAPAGQPLAAALSDEVLVVQIESEGGYKLLASMLGSNETYELPVGDGDVGGIDVDGELVVWWEGAYDTASASYSDQHIYAYRLPDGPKIEVAGGRDSTAQTTTTSAAPAEGDSTTDATAGQGTTTSLAGDTGAGVGYPQTAGPWVTWVQGRPWEENPDEYWRMPIFGALVDKAGKPVDDPTSLVPSVVASVIGDSTWTYSLSEKYLAWEQGVEADGFTTGTHVLDLGTLETQTIGVEAWRPSLVDDILVYWENGLQAMDLGSGKHTLIDARGDFAAAAPTFAAYSRMVEGADGGYEVVARGYTGGYEQVLAQQADAPWLSAPIEVSANHVAFLSGGGLHLFEWKGR